ncbi:MAG: putative methylated-DNA-protein-cysteine methyltransferase [Frankiales bacterium]|nr:putative methylated-DNA-protein-cysteine methyltransferase [Frankiales bacterium]
MKHAISHAVIDSPIGPLTLVADGDALAGLYLAEHRHRPVIDCPRDDTVLPDVREQLTGYFDRDLKEFAVTMKAQGSPFQQQVWAALTTIPYGETWSYGRLAAAIGRPGAARAVGLANGRNPVSVVVPCHRVVGADGSLTGYGGGVERKQWLLTHEAG